MVGSGWIQRSRRHKPVVVKEWTVSDVQSVWLELGEAAEELHWAVSTAAGPQLVQYWANKMPGWINERGEPWPF